MDIILREELLQLGLALMALAEPESSADVQSETDIIPQEKFNWRIPFGAIWIVQTGGNVEEIYMLKPQTGK